MLRRIIRSYRPKIQFRKGGKSNQFDQSEPSPTIPEEYTQPKYLLLERRMTEEEIDLINQGGRSPPINWKKIAPLTDIHSTY
jgi:hypothetical protein